MSGRAEYLCYTDGSCKPVEGAPGGWGFVVKPPAGPSIEGYGKAIGTLSKAMEYRAMAEALAVVPEGAAVTVFSDDRSLVENMTRNLGAWRENAFTKVDPAIVDSVRAVASAIADRRLVVRWQWVRSHNGNAGNERADALAAQGAREAKAELGPPDAKRGARASRR